MSDEMSTDMDVTPDVSIKAEVEESTNGKNEDEQMEVDVDTCNIKMEMDSILENNNSSINKSNAPWNLEYIFNGKHLEDKLPLNIGRQLPHDLSMKELSVASLFYAYAPAILENLDEGESCFCC